MSQEQGDVQQHLSDLERMRVQSEIDKNNAEKAKLEAEKIKLERDADEVKRRIGPLSWFRPILLAVLGVATLVTFGAS